MKRNLIISGVLASYILVGVAFYMIGAHKAEKRLPIVDSREVAPNRVIYTGQPIGPGPTVKVSDLFPRTGATSTPVDITGDFKMVERIYTDYDDRVTKYNCTSFIISSGDESFIRKYKELVEHGNTVNSIDTDGNLVINLDLKNTPQNIADKIITSKGKITLRVTERTPRERDAEPCESFVDVLSIRS